MLPDGVLVGNATCTVKPATVGVTYQAGVVPDPRVGSLAGVKMTIGAAPYAVWNATCPDVPEPLVTVTDTLPATSESWFATMWLALPPDTVERLRLDPLPRVTPPTDVVGPERVMALPEMPIGPGFCCPLGTGPEIRFAVMPLFPVTLRAPLMVAFPVTLALPRKVAVPPTLSAPVAESGPFTASAGTDRFPLASTPSATVLLFSLRFNGEVVPEG